MKKISLVIMAAGLGSRFGEGIKQLEPVGPNGETIMDYSIKEAMNAGFNEVVFIIRKDIKEEFDKRIGNRIKNIIDCKYVYQDVKNVPDFYKNETRTKPWGTGHAILSIKDAIDNPFAVINADDYYGVECYKKVYNFLTTTNDDSKYNYCLVGYKLKNTMSPNGSVNRGILTLDSSSNLKDIEEVYNIRYEDSKIVADDYEVKGDDLVSMNLFGFSESLITELDSRFNEFLKNISEDDQKSEFILPGVVKDLIDENKANVKVLDTDDKWVGFTYKTDKDLVVQELNKIYK